jgi:integrase/recombinase XerD
MATCLFRSSLAFRLQTFLETRRAAGRDDVGTQKILIYLDRFLMSELKPGRPITREIVEHWFKSLEHLSTGTRINRISILRQFCLYLSHFDPRTCMVHRSFVPHRTRPVPHIYTRNEVHRIMAACKRIGPTEGLRPMAFSNLIGLLYSTGLRIGEALKLDNRRRRSQTSAHSHPVKANFKNLATFRCQSPQRIIWQPICTGARQRAGFPTSSTSPVFVTPAGGRYGKSTIATIFLEIVRKIGIRGPKGPARTSIGVPRIQTPGFFISTMASALSADPSWSTLTLLGRGTGLPSSATT